MNHSERIEWETLRPLDESKEDVASFVALCDHYLRDCGYQLGSRRYVGYFAEKILLVALFEVVMPSRDNVFTWVVGGDLPPAKIPTRFASNAIQALNSYMGEMRAWTEAALAGQSVAHLMPVNVPPTIEYASMLRSRLDWLDRCVLGPNRQWLKGTPDPG